MNEGQLWSSLCRAHLLRLHQLQNPRRRPGSSETPGHLCSPPSLRAEGPLPTPWRPESPANTQRFTGVEVWEERLHPALGTGHGRVEGEQKWDGKRGIVMCLLLPFIISSQGLLKSLHANKSSWHQCGQSLFRAPTFCTVHMTEETYFPPISISTLCSERDWQQILPDDSSDLHMNTHNHRETILYARSAQNLES